MCHAEAKPPLRFSHGFQPFYALHYAPGLARHTQALAERIDMDRWLAYLFESHSEDTYKYWAKKLKLFRFFRANGGHANDGDSLDVVYAYNSLEEMTNFFEDLGIKLKTYHEKPDQPVPGKGYRGDIFAQFPSLIPNTQWIEQPKHCVIDGVKVLIWCYNNQIKISIGTDYRVSVTDFENAEKVERVLSKVDLEVIDPPRDSKHYISPKHYPSYFS